MGSTKSFRYEVLVYPKDQTQPNAMTSSNSVSQPFLLQTQVQRFTCDRENMQQYWIPEGFHPVLVPRACLQSSLSAANNDNTRQIMTPSASAGNAQILSNSSSNVNVPSRPLQTRTVAATPNIIIGGGGGGVMTSQPMKRRRPAKNQIIVPRLHPKSLSAQALYYFQKRRELIENRSFISSTNGSNVSLGAVPNHPSKTIEQMWQEEPDNVKRHYDRLALRVKIEQALLSRANNNKKRYQPYNVDRNVTSLEGSSRVSRSHHLQGTMMNTMNITNNNNCSSLNRSFNVSLTENLNDNTCNALPSSSQGFTQSHMLNLDTSPVPSYRSVQNKDASNIVGNDCTSSSDNEDSDEIFDSHNDFMNADDPYDSPISSSSSSPKISATKTNDNNNDIEQ